MESIIWTCVMTLLCRWSQLKFSNSGVFALEKKKKNWMELFRKKFLHLRKASFYILEILFRHCACYFFFLLCFFLLLFALVHSPLPIKLTFIWISAKIGDRDQIEEKTKKSRLYAQSWIEFREKKFHYIFFSPLCGETSKVKKSLLETPKNIWAGSVICTKASTFYGSSLFVVECR